MIEEMKSYINGEKQPEKGKKPIKPQDLVRLYDTGMFEFGSLRTRTDHRELEQMEARVNLPGSTEGWSFY